MVRTEYYVATDTQTGLIALFIYLFNYVLLLFFPVIEHSS